MSGAQAHEHSGRRSLLGRGRTLGGVAPRGAGALFSCAMRIAIEVDEHAFLHPKSREDVEREVMEAASFYWLVRGDIEQVRAPNVARPPRRDLVDVLLSAPTAGEDADFERVQDVGRRGIEWDT